MNHNKEPFRSNIILQVHHRNIKRRLLDSERENNITLYLILKKLKTEIFYLIRHKSVMTYIYIQLRIYNLFSSPNASLNIVTIWYILSTCQEKIRLFWSPNKQNKVHIPFQSIHFYQAHTYRLYFCKQIIIFGAYKILMWITYASGIYTIFNIVIYW